MKPSPGPEQDAEQLLRQLEIDMILQRSKTNAAKERRAVYRNLSLVFIVLMVIALAAGLWFAKSLNKENRAKAPQNTQPTTFSNTP